MQRLSTAGRAALVNAAAVATHGKAQPARNAVNLSALKMRIRATNNVAKLTAVMKLVASSKLRAVEDTLARGRPFGEAILSAVALPDLEEKVKVAGAKVDEDEARGYFVDDKKHLVVVITTDKGLCGSVNSSISRSMRREIAAAQRANASIRLFTLGDKGRAQIARDYTSITERAIDNYLDKDPIFPAAAVIASKIVSAPYDVLTLYYNHYESQVKFKTVAKRIPKLTGLPSGSLPPSFKGFEIEPEIPEEVLANMEEYAIASALYFALLETVACETAQRIIAMDAASTNASDMVDRFKLIYNRARQAKITTELSEINAGAEASAVVAGVSD